MNFPDTLQQLLDSAEAAMLAHPHGHLAANYRRAIYNHLILITDFHIEVRATLAFITAEYVLPFWNTAHPDNLFPKQTLTMLERWLNGVVDDEAMYTLSQNGALFIEHSGATSRGSEAAFFAAGAAIAAIFESLGSVLDIGEAPSEPEDAEIQPRGLGDTAYWAMAAYASPSEALQLDAQRCRAFWHWWLTYAIPAAWKD